MNKFVGISIKEDNKYVLKNHSRISMPNEDTDIVVIDDNIPLYSYQGEKGGGHTYIYIYFRENRIEIHIDYVYVNMSNIDDPV